MYPFICLTGKAIEVLDTEGNTHERKGSECIWTIRHSNECMLLRLQQKAYFTLHNHIFFRQKS
uniref:Uncharacterized protein n=1 Tax=Arundo donax TaxID=35708 RepID=A0A0A8Y3P9_ARUDO